MILLFNLKGSVSLVSNAGKVIARSNRFTVMIFLTKSILELILTGLAIVNLVVMLELLGRTEERRFNPKKLRLIHRLSGYFFIVFSFSSPTFA